jgi:hypothetical protein
VPNACGYDEALGSRRPQLWHTRDYKCNGLRRSFSALGFLVLYRFRLFVKRRQKLLVRGERPE